MPDKKNERDKMEIPDLINDEFSIDSLLRNINKEKLLNMIATINSKISKKDSRLEVLEMLKEFLPEDKCRIVDVFISVLNGKIN